MKLYLGVDGGQSSTTALIADEEGAVLGMGSAGPCNHVGNEQAAAKLKRVIGVCVDSAGRAAGLAGPISFEAACFGMSGGAADKEKTLREAVRARHWRLTDDAVIALAGALAGGPGVVIIAGTGSIALARGWDGEFHRAGGWGYVFGDEGSAFDIVRQALRACLRAEEGWGPATRLQGEMLAHTGCQDLHEVLHLFYKPEWPRSRVAEFAVRVDQKACEGDAVSRQILTFAAQSLAMLAQTAASQIRANAEGVTCSYTGGVFEGSFVLPHYRGLLELNGYAVRAPVFGPATGALIEAYHLNGLTAPVDKLLSSGFLHE